VGHDKITAASKAGNSAAPLLALYLGGGSGTLGGEVLVAFISAVTFATILAVVAGLLIAAASNISHDLYTHVAKSGVSTEREQVITARIATVTVGVIAIGLSLYAKSLNVAVLVGLAYAVAASANLPVILYSLYWRRFNTAGAMSAICVGLLSSVGLVLVGPAVIGAKGLIFTDVQPLTSLNNPGIISIPLGFLAGWLGTVLFRARAEERREFRRSEGARADGIRGGRSTHAH
jgi:cation/acetate symporter